MPFSVTKNLKPVFDTENALLDTSKTSAMIVNARKEMNIPQKALAMEMGISIAYLSDLESGKRHWKLKLFNRAKSALEKMQSNP